MIMNSLRYFIRVYNFEFLLQSLAIFLLNKLYSTLFSSVVCLIPNFKMFFTIFSQLHVNLNPLINKQ
jgi:hypothetical protein